VWWKKEFGMPLSSILHIIPGGDKWNSPFSKFESELSLLILINQYSYKM
jgi:hypothetical protein